jgi:hypothetical protein
MCIANLEKLGISWHAEVALPLIGQMLARVRNTRALSEIGYRKRGVEVA